MKKFLWALPLAFLTFTFFSLGTNKKTTQEGSVFAEEYVPNEVLVKFKEDVDKFLIRAALGSVQAKVVSYLKKEIGVFEWDPQVASSKSFLSFPSLLHIKVPEYIGTEQAIALLGSNPDVEYAAKNLIYRADATSPNDPDFIKLWGLDNTGQTGGTADADIDAPEAWDIFSGSSNIVIAVTDTGIDYDHPDLSANIWKNPGETGGGKENNGIDDDGNGYIDDWRGWNFVYENNNPMDDDAYQEHYHGTHVSGTIGAVGNNGRGVCGVNWRAKLMALKILDLSGHCADSDAIVAIEYAANNGAHIINASWGNYAYSQSLRDAISYARTRGKLFVAAAGNN